MKRLIAAAFLFAAFAPFTAGAADLVVFAAASTQQVVREAVAAFTAETDTKIRPVFHSSGALARQIEAGAPADLFLSANVAWVDHLIERNAVDAASRRVLFRNRLVIVAPVAAHSIGEAGGAAAALRALAPGERLAIANPDHVPAGIYTKQALASLGLWASLEKRTARAPHVRATLALVERGEAPLGIVYRTDALQSRGVREIAAFDERLHDPIAYQAVRISAQNEAAAGLLAFLVSRKAAAIYDRYGFVFE